MSRSPRSRSESQAFAHAISRREFMKYCLAASSSALFMNPLRVFLGSLVDGLIGNAQAQAIGRNPRNYFSLILAGGPPRWVYDLPLRVMPGDPDPGNTSMIATHMQGATRRYGTVKMGKYNLPMLWKTGLHYAGGQTSDMSPLARHMAIIRGIQSIDSHGVGRNLQTRPDTAKPSLHGLVADHSHLNLPAVRLLGATTFKSHSGVGELALDSLATSGGLTPLEQIMAPFSENRSGAFFQKKRDLDPFVQDALRALREHHVAGTPGIESLYTNASKAELQLREGLGSLSSEYNRLYAKYLKVIQNVYSSSDWQSKLGFNMSGVSFNIPNLANVFAVAEHLFNAKLSSTVHATVGNMGRVAAGGRIGELTNDSGAELQAVVNDAHQASADQHLRNFSFYYRAIASCIYEFSRSVSDWENTVVHLGSEFTRNPRNVDNGASEGSDHGWRGTNVSLYSGAIDNGPYVAGNIRRDSSVNYQGIWGMGDLVSIDVADKHLGIGNMASGIAHLLGVDSPQPNFASPIYLSGKTVESLIGAPKVGG